ncbi:MAG: FAD-dependent oxidoreductase, partial [Desulfobacula sp.]|nr:FAD-dependent oxidoreductase [Desulfobacula sp.]
VEIIYAAEHGNIRHISDLLLRRVRIGLLLPRGGINILDRVESLCKPYLSWDSKRWYKEKKDYIRLWNNYYSPPSVKQGA